MKKMSSLRRICLLVPVLSLTLMSAAAAQEVGETYTVLVPIDAVPNLRSYAVVVTGGTKDAITVGDCKAGDFRPQTAELVHRDGEEPTVTSEVIVIDLGYRNDPPPFNGIELALGTRLGSFGGGGECGPGYAGLFAHVLAQ